MSRFRKKNYLALIGLVVILVLGPLAYFRFIKPKMATASWFDDGWHYRKAVNITNGSGSNLTDFQVSISIGTSQPIVEGKMKSDCSDIRITDINGKLLPHWLEGPCNSTTNATVWAKIPNISTSGVTVYVYYGNPGASSGTNPDNFFGTSTTPAGPDCTDIRNHHSSTGADGNYWIDPDNTGGEIPFEVYCDLTTDNGGWTKIEYSEDLPHINRWTTGDAWRWLDTNFTTVLSTAQIQAIQALSTNGKQRYDGTCQGTLHYYFTSSAIYDYAFGFRFLNEDETTSGTQNMGGIDFSIVEDNCAANSGTLYHTIWDINDVRVPIINARSRDSGNSGEAFGSALTQNPAWLKGTIEDNNVSASSPGTEEISKAPIAYWSFDEGQGTTVNDSSSNRNNGTLGTGNSAPVWQDESMCISGKCLKYDGNDSVGFGSGQNLDIPGDLTVCAWIKFNSVSGSGGVIHRGSGSSNVYNSSNYTLRLTGGDLYFAIGDDTDNNNYTHNIVISSVETNKWYFICSGAEGENMFWSVDGKTKNQSTLNYSTKDTQSNVLLIGKNGGNEFFTGFVDEVKIYPYARSAREIKADFNARGTSKGSSVQIGDKSASINNGLIGYWNFDVGTGTSVPDLSGNSNTATFGADSSAPGWSTGMYGIGVSFDGNNDYASADMLSQISDEFTTSAWIYPTRLEPQAETYGNTILATSSSYGLWILHNNGAIRVYAFSSDAVNRYYQTTATPITLNNWFHIVVTAKRNGEGKIYVNGSYLESFTAENDTGLDGVLGFGDLRLGRNLTHQGLIDEVRIYNRALSPAEVSDLYEWAPGPAAYYDFEDAGGQAVTDKSGNGYNGTLGAGNSAPTWSTGKYGKALFFDNNDYVDTNYFPPAGPKTVSYWVKYSTLTGTSLIGISETGKRFYCGINSASSYFLGVGTTYAIGSFPNSLSTQKWYYTTLTFDGSTAYYYIDGNQVGSIAATQISPPTRSFFVGKYNGGSPLGNFTGYIDDLKIYNYARTQKQIVEDMNAGHPNVGSPVGSALAHYKFDEGYGTTVNNSGNGGSVLNGTLGGTTLPEWSNNGKFGKALSFNGINSYVSKSDNDSLDMRTGSFSAFAWIKAVNATGSHDVILDKGGTSTGSVGYWFSLETNGTLQLLISDGSSYLVSANSNGIVGDNAWHQVGFTWNPSSGARFYIDGKLDKIVSASTSVDLNSGASFFIGGYTSSGFTLNGLIDEVKIYNYALTQDEIYTDFNHGSALMLGTKAGNTTGTGNTAASNASSQVYCIPGDTTACSPPVAEWLMDEGIGSSAFDTSGNGNNGALGIGNSAPSWAIGKIGKGLRFDGNDYVLGGNTEIPQNGPATIAGWFKFNRLASEKGSHNYLHNVLYQHSANDNLYIFGTNGYFSTASSLAKNSWTHIVVIYNGDNSTALLYINGKKYSVNVGTAQNIAAISALRIGGINTSFFDGTVDNLRVYNYVRSPAQIAWDYNKGTPVAHWKLDECQGAVAHDSAADPAGGGTRNDGTITIGPSGSQTSQGTCSLGVGQSSAWANGATGKYNASLNFDGTDDLVYMGNKLNMGNFNFSISAWVKSTSTATGNGNGIVYKKHTSQAYTSGYSLNMPNGSFQFRIGDGTNFVNLIAGSNYNNNQWHHVVAVAKRGSRMEIFINGNKINESIETNVGNIDNELDLAIGGLYLGSKYHLFNGQIDEVKIWNYALTAEQVKLLYNQGAVYFGD